MAPKSTAPKKPKSSLSKATPVKLDTATSSSKRFNPLTAFAFSSTQESSGASSQSSAKGKGKAIETNGRGEGQDDRLWVDIYEPTTEAELAVHNRKVEDVRRWILEAFEGGPSGKLTKYRRILALTGPAGTAKTTTVRVLAREMGFEILEWRNAVGESSTAGFGDTDSYPKNFDSDYESLFTKFESFLNRASSCQSIFTTTNTKSKTPASSQASQSSRVQPQPEPKRHIILLEDLPNILHANTQLQFQATLQALVDSPTPIPPVPVIIIVSDAGMRGEASDERMASGGWGKDKDGVVDIRSVLSKNLLSGPYVTQIAFNPIAPTLLRKALQALLNTHFSSSTKIAAPSKDVLDIIVESANGDIRSAIMALQFACIVQLPKGRKKAGEGGATVVLEAVTRREQSLALFHLMGKVLYNKRKGDDPSSSASAKDIQREKDLDMRLKDQPKLPPHLEHHTRRTSRVDVDLLYADSPIDSSLYSLYIQQNYTQFCNDVDECDGIAEWLSWIDSSGGEAWYQANPHRFHLLTMGTLHSLPSPVARRSQKFFKPEFFDVLRKEKDAWDGVRDARGWVLGEGAGTEASAWRAGGWSRSDVAMELGGILKARDAGASGMPRPPASHRLFSRMAFSYASAGGGMRPLGEREVDSRDEFEVDGDLDAFRERKAEESGGWLDSDDIEDF